MLKINLKKISEQLAFSIIFLAVFLNFIKYNSYGYFRPEIIFIGVGLILLGLFLSWIYHFANHIVKPLLLQ